MKVLSLLRALLGALCLLLAAASPSLAAVAYKGALYSDKTVANGGLNSITVGVTNPSGALTVAAGDKLFIIVTVSTGGSGNDPGTISVTGFTAIGQGFDGINNRTYLGWRDAIGGDTASFAASWAGTASRGVSWELIAFTGVATGAPAAAGPTANASSTNMAAPSVTAATASDMIMSAVTNFGNNGTYTKPASMTTIADVALTGSTASTVPEIFSAYEQLSASGVTGTRTFTQGLNDLSYGMTVLLTAPGAGGATAHRRQFFGVGH